MSFSIYQTYDDDFILDGKKYKINASFDNILKAIDLMNNKELDNLTKILVGTTMIFSEDITSVSATGSLDDFINELNRIFGKDYTIEDLHTILNAALEEYIQSKEEIEYDDLGNVVPKVESAENEKLMDIDYDAKEIYSSFMQAYGIDLHDQIGKMHWYKFTSLLSGLPEKTRIREIIQYRAYKKPSGNSDDYHMQMLKLQQEYALPDKYDEDEEYDELEGVEENYE